MKRTTTRLWPSLLVSALAMVAAVVVLTFHAQLLAHGDRPLPYQLSPDSDPYLQIAMGRLADVPPFFSRHILYPSAVGFVAALLHVDLPQAFMAANLLCWALLAYCVAALLDRTTGRPLLALIPLLSAFGYQELAQAYLPDLLDAALAALFLLLLVEKRVWWAFFTLFLFGLVRDDAFFFCAVFAAVAFYDGARHLGKRALLVIILGFLACSFTSFYGRPGVYFLGEAFYLALNAPGNLAANLTGTGLGPRHAATTFIDLLTIFGSGPLFLHLLRREWNAADPPVAIRTALVFGTRWYFLALLLGTSTFRLIGFAWPAVWIALPWLLAKLDYRPPAWKAAILLACFWGLSWLPDLALPASASWYAVPAPIALFYATTFVCLRSFRQDCRAPAHRVPG